MTTRWLVQFRYLKISQSKAFINHNTKMVDNMVDIWNIFCLRIIFKELKMIKPEYLSHPCCIYHLRYFITDIHSIFWSGFWVCWRSLSWDCLDKRSPLLYNPLISHLPSFKKIWPASTIKWRMERSSMIIFRHILIMPSNTMHAEFCLIWDWLLFGSNSNWKESSLMWCEIDLCLETTVIESTFWR